MTRRQRKRQVYARAMQRVARPWPLFELWRPIYSSKVCLFIDGHLIDGCPYDYRSVTGPYFWPDKGAT